MCTRGLVPLLAHPLLGFLEALSGLEVHHLQVDLCEKRCHLVVLEVPVALEGLASRGSLGPPEARPHSFPGGLSPLYFLSHLVLQGLLGGQALMTQDFQELREDHWDPVGHELPWALVGLESLLLPSPGMPHNILLDHEILEGPCLLSNP